MVLGPPPLKLPTLEEQRKYLYQAYCAAQDSVDPSTQNGAVIVGVYDQVVEACNTYPDGVIDKPERLERPLKYSYIEHAERNVIYRAAAHGVTTKGATMYVPWFACADCARSIIQAKIAIVVGHQQMFDKTPDRWKESIEIALGMMEEAEIKTIMYDGPISPAIRFNGEIWYP